MKDCSLFENRSPALTMEDAYRILGEHGPMLAEVLMAMVVATDLPPCRAHMLAPCPRCAIVTRPRAISGAILQRAEAT